MCDVCALCREVACRWTTCAARAWTSQSLVNRCVRGGVCEDRTYVYVSTCKCVSTWRDGVNRVCDACVHCVVRWLRAGVCGRRAACTRAGALAGSQASSMHHRRGVKARRRGGIARGRARPHTTGVARLVGVWY